MSLSIAMRPKSIEERFTESFQVLQRDRNSKGGELFESP